MSKRATPLKKPEIMLDQNASAPLYRQLYERLRGSILTGQLEAGTRLPSTRVLASSLGVSRTTTALAYELLLLEGYIESRVGDGTRVAHLQPEQVFQGDRNAQDLDASDTAETPPPAFARPGAHRSAVSRSILRGAGASRKEPVPRWPSRCDLLSL